MHFRLAEYIDDDGSLDQQDEKEITAIFKPPLYTATDNLDPSTSGTATISCRLFISRTFHEMQRFWNKIKEYNYAIRLKSIEFKLLYLIQLYTSLEFEPFGPVRNGRRSLKTLMIENS